MAQQPINVDDIVKSIVNTPQQPAISNAQVMKTINSTIPAQRPNVLRNFSSYNCVISLEVTHSKNYNTAIGTTTYNSGQWDVVCKTSGRGLANPAYGFATNGGSTTPSIAAPQTTSGDTAQQATPPTSDTTTYPKRQASPDPKMFPHGFFSPDFYLDDIDITSIVGLGQSNRGAAPMTLNFNVIEPYGMNFLENLFYYCKVGLGEENYLQLPYMLKIEFEGYLDDGSYSTIPENTKYIPIRLMTIGVKANNTGATYKVEAIALNNIGHSEQLGRVPTYLSLSQPQNGTDTLHGYTSRFISFLNTINYNLFNKANLLDNCDEYYIDFADPDMAANLLYLDKHETQADATPTAAPKQNACFNATVERAKLEKQAKQRVQQHNMPAKKIVFAAGSTILDSLNNLIISSEYVQAQIRNINTIKQNFYQAAAAGSFGSPGDTGNTAFGYAAQLYSTPLNWFTIQSHIDYKGYSFVAGRHTYRIIYTVTPHVIYNSPSMDVGNGNPAPRTVKTYNYMFTGDNSEILSWDLNFDVAFMSFAQFNNGVVDQATGDAATPPNPQDKTGENSAGGGPASNPSWNMPNIPTQPDAINAGGSYNLTASNPKRLYGVGSLNPEAVQAGSVASTIYAPGEMLTLKMSVLGDPDWIKQDGIFFDMFTITNGKSSAEVDSILNNPFYTGKNGGSGFLFDAGEIYMQANFKIPIRGDIELKTGTLPLANSSSNVVDYTQSVFSGQYKLMTIISKFQKGLFTQELEAIRVNNSHSPVTDGTAYASLLQTINKIFISNLPSPATSAGPALINAYKDPGLLGTLWNGFVDSQKEVWNFINSGRKNW